MGNNDTLNAKLIEIELAKSDLRNSKVKKYLPAFVLMASSYYSLLLTAGLVVGYLVSKLFSKYFLEKGKVEPVYIDCGKWKVHLHHWIMGAIVMVLLVLTYKFSITGFFAGIIFGVMAHDIYDYNDWHKVVVKNEDFKEVK